MSNKNVIRHIIDSFFDFSKIPLISRSKYNVLTFLAEYYIKNRSTMLLYYKSELNFIFQRDFKNILFIRTINILSRVINSEILPMIETSHKKLPKTRKDFGNINKVSDKQRIEFAKTFGVKSLKVRRQRIRQIRFKPGYLRFFRRLRNDYKKTNSISLKYQ